MPRQSKFDEKLDNAWNAGLRLRQVPAFMARFGFGSDNLKLIIEGWRARKKEFGCACVRRKFGWHPDDAEREARANAAYVTLPMFGGKGTYADWKGITGPGKLLRDILAKEKNEKSE